MTTLNQQDFVKILDFLLHLYNFDNLKNLPEYLCLNISQLIPADSTEFSTLNFKTKLTSFQTYRNLKFDKPSDSFIKKHFWEHPFTSHYQKTFNFEAVKISDFLSESELHRKIGLYHRFLHPLGLEEQIAIAVMDKSTDNGELLTLSLSRPERSFTEEDRLILNLLSAHIRQAHQNAEIIADIYQENEDLRQLLKTTAQVIVSKNGQIQLISPIAIKLIEQYFPWQQWGTFLPETLLQWVKYQHQLHLETSLVLQPSQPLLVEQADKQLRIHFILSHVKEQYLLLLEERSKNQLSVKSLALLGLSKREAEVLLWIAKGKENSEIATELRVTIGTVRKHLENIYGKLGVKSRATAIIKALNLLGILSDRSE